MSPTPIHEPHSTLEVSERDPETYQKEVIQYPDHSYPQAVPVEHAAAAGATHSFYSPESAKEVVVEAPHNAYAGAGVLPMPYKDPNYAGGAAYQNTAAYHNGYPAGGVYPDGSSYSNSAYPNSAYPNSAYPNSAYPTSNGSQMDPNAYGQTPAGDGGQYPPTDEKAGRKATICGIPRKIFFILLGVGIAVIVLVAGLAGGLTSKNHSGAKAVSSSGSSDSPKDPASTNSTQKLILDNSKITASNWTDSNGVIHRTVFFQDVYNAIIARRWDSKGKSWTTNNLTQLMAATTTPLNPLPGTPLASASMDLNPKYETHVWFTDPSNTIRSMAAFDALNRPDSWDNDTLSGAVLQTWPGSGLAAMWQRCWHSNCNGTWIVAYQRPEGAIKTANSSTWASATVAIDSSNVAANSSLAIIPQLDGAYLDRLELVSERVDSGQTGDMRVTTFNDTWNGSEQRVTELQSGIPLPATSQQFAITKWDSWNQALYLSLLQGGKLQGNHWDGKTMNNISSFNFKSGPDTNFTSIAMTPDAMFYGISNNEIVEYSLDTTDPSTFNYVGTVFP